MNCELYTTVLQTGQKVSFKLQAANCQTPKITLKKKKLPQGQLAPVMGNVMSIMQPKVFTVHKGESGATPQH